MNIVDRPGDALISVDDAKLNGRDTLNVEDELWTRWVKLAHEVVERDTGLILQRAVIDDVFTDGYITLRSPARSIVSVKTYDDDGNETITTDYKLTVKPNYGLRVELTTVPANYAVIRYVAGFGNYTPPVDEVSINSGDISEHSTHEQVLLAITDHFFENRSIVSDFQKYAISNSFKYLTNQITNHR